jgi:antagonist of KipI
MTHLKVLRPGLATRVVDHGRPHCRSLGLPVGGAADRAALALGNALVGNPPDAAALEITLAGPTVEAAGGTLACVVYGAPFELTSDRQPLAPGKTFTLAPGERLQVGGAAAGVRAYLCVRGGLQVPEVLGSRSGLGPVRAEDELPCLPGAIRPRFFRHEFSWGRVPSLLRYVDGRQADWFPARALSRGAYTVGPDSDRMGLRLGGEPLAVPPREIVSEPVCPGTVQVTPDGRCIVLGVDGQTIGGYPKVAQVVRADLDKLGRLRPGDAVRFRRVSLARAEDLSRRQRAELGRWLARLRASGDLLAPPAGTP